MNYYPWFIYIKPLVVGEIQNKNFFCMHLGFVYYFLIFDKLYHKRT